MDSCNSGSMSSSGGDDEYDSRAESSFSVFLNHHTSNHNPLTHVGPMSHPPPPDHHHHHQHQTHHSMFDPLSNYFDPLSSSSSSSRTPPSLANPNSLLNLDMVWSKNLRSDINCTDLGGFVAASSSPTQQFFTNQTQSRPTFNPSVQIAQVQETASTRGSGLASASGSGSNDQPITGAAATTNMVRNPKKRSRASRRAPTTVLTTDTTNFRAMVQEFTGIPAPPFTSSHFPRSRLDLFGTAASLRSVASHLEPSHPSYLLRPFAQKIQPPFLSSSPSMIDAIASTTTTTNINNNSGNATNTTTTTTSNSDLGLLKYPQNLLNINMQNNPILNFHSLLQPSPKYPLPNTSILGSSDTTKPQQQGSLDIPSNDSHLKMGVFEEFGLSHGHVSANLTGLQNIVSSSDTALRRSDNSSSNNNSSNWGDGNEGDLLRSINGNYDSTNNNNSNTQRAVANNGKVNYSGSSSDFHRGDKGPETTNVQVANTRSEGMVESWICSSD